MKDGFVNNISKSNSYKTLSDTYKVPSELCHPNYPHITFKITSLSEYLEVINVIKSTSSKNESDLIFRGMTDYSWELLPSIARQTLVHEPTEHKMVNELMLLYPEEFSNISSNFDLLAKMQHYGLPTRLLDFTTNPLVALFFACIGSKNNTIGRVIGTNPVYQHFTDEYIESICGIWKAQDFNSCNIEKFTDNIASLVELMYCVKYPLIAKPQYSNERIKNQSAMFMVFQDEIWDFGAMKAYETYNELGPIGIASIRKEHRKIIELENLKEIYPIAHLPSHHPQNWFVTHKTLSAVCKCYEADKNTKVKGEFISQMFSKTSFPFRERFYIVPQIKKIEMEIMKSSFFSILIDPKDKKKILKELDLININERFLFPELEYTVKYIKDKYWTPFKG